MPDNKILRDLTERRLPLDRVLADAYDKTAKSVMRGNLGKAAQLVSDAIDAVESSGYENNPTYISFLTKLLSWFDPRTLESAFAIDFIEAEPLLRQMTRMKERVFGKENIKTIEHIRFLALVYMHHLARPADARELLERCVAASRQVPDLTALAWANYYCGAYATAESLCEEVMSAVGTSQEVPSASYSLMSDLLHLLALIRHHQGRLPEAEEFLKRSIRRASALEGSSVHVVSSLQRELADLQREMGKDKEAGSTSRRAALVGPGMPSFGTVFGLGVFMTLGLWILDEVMLKGQIRPLSNWAGRVVGGFLTSAVVVFLIWGLAYSVVAIRRWLADKSDSKD